jgi:hypothetical protein
LFSSVNGFAALVDLEDNDDSLGPVSSIEYNSVPARSRKVHRLSSVSDDLGSVEHLVLAAVVQNSLAASAMTDSGATSDFMNPAYAIKHKLPIQLKKYPETLELADGSPAGEITHTATVTLLIDQHLERITLQLSTLAHYDIILGKSWLKRHNPTIDWRRDTITFADPFCQENCLPTRVIPRPIHSSHSPVPDKKIAVICAAAYVKHVKSSTHCFAMHMRQIYATTSKTAEEIVPRQYHNYLNLFRKPAAAKLPEHKTYDHEIPLVPGKSPPFGPMYGLSEPELKALREYIDENLARSFICASSSPAAAPILFAKKKDGTLCLCVDY